ncbi:MAG: hypothetical protein Q8P67_29425, partial [archaeon]|nr:hypothetical protein [archaeon]
MSSEDDSGGSGSVVTVLIDVKEPRLPSDETTEAIVIGAGIAGSAMAFALGVQRRRVIALERDLSEPNRIVGELLQPGGVETLNALGLGECVEDIDAQAIQGYVVIRGEDQISLTYPNSVLGVAFHHGRFVQRLRAAAEQHRESGLVDLRQGTAVALLEDRASGRVVGVEWRAPRAKETRRIFAPLTVE